MLDEPTLDYDADLGLPLIADQEGRTLGVASSPPKAVTPVVPWHGSARLGYAGKGRHVQVEYDYREDKFAVRLWRGETLLSVRHEVHFLDALRAGEAMWNS